MSAKVRDNTDRIAALHETGVDWDTRTVWIVGELLDGKAYKYLPALLMLDETPGPIRVVIVSEGGEEDGGFAIYDTIRSLKNTVTTIGVGRVYSIAALILQAGDRRLLSANCQLMMHNGTVELHGDVRSDEIKKLALESVRNDGRYHKAIADRSKVDLWDLKKWCKAERYFNAEEAVELGFADAIAGAKDL